MPTSKRTTTMFLALLAGSAMMAMPAGAEERCTGTLCDLYYGGPPPETPPAAAPAAPKPLMVPSLSVPSAGVLGRLFSPGDSAPAAAPPAPGAAPAPTARPLVGVGGGGLLGLSKGAPAERCGGTLCDLYYGSPSPEEERAAREAEHPEGAGTPAAPPAAQTAADEPVEEPAPAPARRHRAPPAELDTPRCASSIGHDPWSCYR